MNRADLSLVWHRVYLTVFTLLLFLPKAYASDPVTLYSEHYPPFNFHSNNVAQGISVELLQLMYQNMGEDFAPDMIQFVPWPRGYQRALKQKNSMLFSTYRTPAREHLFKWVGPIASSQNGLIFRSYEPKEYSNYEHLKGLRIGVIKNDIGGVLLEALNVPGIHIVSLSSPEKAARMLEHDRLDAWAYDINVARYIQRQLGFLPAEYTVGLRFGQPGRLYFAFNVDTEESVIKKFQHALEKAKELRDESGNNAFQEILKRYSYQLTD